MGCTTSKLFDPDLDVHKIQWHEFRGDIDDHFDEILHAEPKRFSQPNVAEKVSWFFANLTSTEPGKRQASTQQVRDILIKHCFPKDNREKMRCHFGQAICNICTNNPMGAAFYRDAETAATLLSAIRAVHSTRDTFAGSAISNIVEAIRAIAASDSKGKEIFATQDAYDTFFACGFAGYANDREKTVKAIDVIITGCDAGLRIFATDDMIKKINSVGSSETDVEAKLGNFRASTMSPSYLARIFDNSTTATTVQQEWRDGFCTEQFVQHIMSNKSKISSSLIANKVLFALMKCGLSQTGRSYLASSLSELYDVVVKRCCVSFGNSNWAYECAGDLIANLAATALSRRQAFATSECASMLTSNLSKATIDSAVNKTATAIAWLLRVDEAKNYFITSEFVSVVAASLKTYAKSVDSASNLVACLGNLCKDSPEGKVLVAANFAAITAIQGAFKTHCASSNNEATSSTLFVSLKNILVDNKSAIKSFATHDFIDVIKAYPEFESSKANRALCLQLLESSLRATEEATLSKNFMQPSFNKNAPNKVASAISVYQSHTLTHRGVSNPNSVQIDRQDWRVAISDDEIAGNRDGIHVFKCQMENARHTSFFMIGITGDPTFGSTKNGMFGYPLSGCGLDVRIGSIYYSKFSFAAPYDATKVIDESLCNRAQEVVVVLTITGGGKKKMLRYIFDGKHHSTPFDASEWMTANRLFPCICMSQPDQQLTMVPIDQL